MTLEELGKLCVNYGLAVTLEPILQGIMITVRCNRTDEEESRLVNTKDLNTILFDMFSFEDYSQ